MPTNFISEEEKEGKASIWSCVQLVTLLNIEDAMFSFNKNTRRPYKSPNNNLRTFVEFLDQWIYALFRPAPPRTAPRIFTLAPPHPAPPRGFLPLPRPALQKNAPPRTSLVSIMVLALQNLNQCQQPSFLSQRIVKV